MSNILICASTFPRYKSDSTVDFIWQQARYLQTHYPNLNIHILCPHDAGAQKHEVWDGIQIHRYNYCWPESWQTLVYPAIWPNIKECKWRVLQVPLLLISLFFAALSISKKHNIQLLYSHWFMPQGLVCSLVSYICGIPHVLTSHAADIVVMNKIPYIGQWLVRKTLPNFGRISFAGTRGRAQALGFFDEKSVSGVAEKSAVIPMGVDFSLPPTDAKNTTDSKRLKLAFVGRLAEKKGVTYLLQALKLALNEGVEADLDILGDGPLLENLKEETEQLGLEGNVKFHGFIAGSEKFKTILACDLFLVPSIVTDDGDAEGLPVSLLEAMAAGTLCCATDESGATDIIHDDETAFLIKGKSPEAIFEIIKKVSEMSGTERELMKKNAKVLGESYEWDNIIHQHYEYLIQPFLADSDGAV